MKLDTLYKRTKTSAIQFWEIQTVSCPSHTIISKKSGQLGTDSPIIHNETLTEGKNLGKANATNHEQQAKLQAKSDWLKKKDEGYKSVSDLGILVGPTDEAYKREETKAIFDSILKKFLEDNLPQFNSDAAGNPKPMLALDYTKVKNITYPCYIQPKLDGVRCLMIVEVKRPGIAVKFLSRSGKEYTTLGHIKQDLSTAGLQESFILDGELYSDSIPFQSIVSAVKKQSPDSLKLQFRAYDIVNDGKQSERASQTSDLVRKINSPLITAVETYIVNSADKVKEQHDNFVQAGYEGAMLRLFDGIYGQGQRSRHLLKVKEFDETEFEFECFEQGQREEDLIAVCCNANGIKFRAKMIGTKLQKQILETECGELQGAMLTVKHFGYTEDGLPRFPIGKGFRNY